MQITKQIADRATVIAARPDGDGAATVASIPNELIASDSPYAGPVGALALAADRWVDHANAANARLLPDARHAENLTAAASIIGEHFRNVVTAGKTETQAIAVADATALAPLPGEAGLYAEFRHDFRSASISDKAKIAASANLQQTSAILQAGWEAFPDTPDNIRTALEERHMLLAHVHRTGLQASHQRQSTLDSILATGPDLDAALDAAKKALQDHTSRKERRAHLEGSLRSIISLVATAGQISPEQAFTLLMAKK